jgi:membrane protein DedA with SNARE-associated domain
LAVVVPAILPPPMPFKIFVLLAGVARVRPATFILAAIIGRGFRYGSEALLAYWYGEQATRFIQQNLPVVSLWLGATIAALAIVYIVWRRRRAA